MIGYCFGLNELCNMLHRYICFRFIHLSIRLPMLYHGASIYFNNKWNYYKSNSTFGGCDIKRCSFCFEAVNIFVALEPKLSGRIGLLTAAICLAGLTITSIHLRPVWKNSTKNGKLFIPLLTDSPNSPVSSFPDCPCM